MDSIPNEIFSHIMSFGPSGYYKRLHKRLMQELLFEIHYEWWQKNDPFISYECSVCEDDITGLAFAVEITNDYLQYWYCPWTASEPSFYTYDRHEDELLCSHCSFRNNLNDLQGWV